MVTRKSVASLSAQERAAYVGAVLKLKAAPSRFNPPTTGRYDDYVYVHMQAMLVLSINDPTQPVANGNWTLVSDMRMPMWAHRCPAFPAWHRELLHQFELDLQAVSGDNTLAIPYWDWSVSQSPGDVPWLSDFMGGDGADGPVTTGPFAGTQNWKLNLSEDGVDHLVRGFGLAQGFSRLPTPAEVTSTLSQPVYDATTWDDSSTLSSFRNQLEGWYVPAGSTVQDGMHNLVHLWVGGNQGTMLPSTSPNDPVFFLHHANVDRLWAAWLAQNPASAPYLPAQPLPGDPGQSLNEPMTFFDPSLSSAPPWSDPPVTPLQMINHHSLNYQYDTETAVAASLEQAPVRRPVAMRARDRFRVRLEELR
jgi:tyrosinase